MHNIPLLVSILRHLKLIRFFKMYHNIAPQATPRTPGDLQLVTICSTSHPSSFPGLDFDIKTYHWAYLRKITQFCFSRTFAVHRRSCPTGRIKHKGKELALHSAIRLGFHLEVLIAPEVARAEISEIHLARPEELSTRPWSLSSNVLPVPHRGQTLFILARKKASMFTFLSHYLIGITISFLSLNVSSSWMNNLMTLYERLMWFFVFEGRFVDIRVKYM